MDFTAKKSRFGCHQNLGWVRMALAVFIACVLLNILLGSAKAASPMPFEEIEVPAADQFTLYGKLYDPTQTRDEEEQETPSGIKYPLVILLHGLGGSNSDWDMSFPTRLVKAGYAVLVMDIRGHGKSVRNARNQRVTWRVFKASDWLMLPKDLEACVKFFKDNAEDYPQVNAEQLAFIGNKLGANIALVAGAKLSQNKANPIKTLVLIAPSKQTKSLETSKAAITYKGPLFVTASQNDPETFADTQLIYRWAIGAKVIKLYKNLDQGVYLLQRQADLQNQITQWLQRFSTNKTSGIPLKKSTSTKPAQATHH